MADKLTELIKAHGELYQEDLGLHAGCCCGASGPSGLDDGQDWHAEHLTKVIRGHLRTRTVAWPRPYGGDDASS